MKNFFYILFVVLLMQGCATTSTEKTVVKVEPSSQPVSQEKDQNVPIKPPENIKQGDKVTLEEPVDLQNVKEEKLAEYTEQNGIIFGKTDFQGVLKAHYVKLEIEKLGKTSRIYKLYIGDSASAQSLPWDFKPVQPGYFFIELPIGKYKIKSISIPVGSTVATENTDVEFEVVPNSIVYAGTLKMVGVKEKIKLGGVPVIKPGFDYTIEVLDERTEGMEIFHNRYPGFSGNIIVELMNINNN